MIDPYEVLGIDRDCDGEAVRSAYRRLAKEAHPDSGGDSEQFARLQASYDLLKDPVRRKVYDDTGYDPELADAKDLKGLLLLEPLVNEMILQAVPRAAEAPAALGYFTESMAAALTQTTPEAKEGLAAFLEKRDAKFR